jgi:phenylacetate-CoA ligase
MHARKHYKELKKIDSFTKQELKVYQDKMVKDLVEYAYTNIPFYKKYYDQYKVNISKITSVDALQELPIIDK